MVVTNMKCGYNQSGWLTCHNICTDLPFQQEHKFSFHALWFDGAGGTIDLEAWPTPTLVLTFQPRYVLPSTTLFFPKKDDPLTSSDTQIQKTTNMSVQSLPLQKSKVKSSPNILLQPRARFSLLISPNKQASQAGGCTSFQLTLMTFYCLRKKILVDQSGFYNKSALYHQ